MKPIRLILAALAFACASFGAQAGGAATLADLGSIVLTSAPQEQVQP